MEKEISRNTVVLQGNDEVGTVQVADDVVAIIAGIAATEVEGVSATAGNITNELMSMVGRNSLTKGVKVEIFNGNVKVELALLLEYGFNIPTTCTKVQEKVKSAVENMTGLEVTDVNVRIVGVDMKKGR